MSWDVLFFATASEPPAAADMPDDWTGEPLGSLATVRETISTACPGTDWTDPGWGLLSQGGLHFEFNLGEDDPCTSFAVHVRGEGDVTGVIGRLATRPGWYAFDTTQGEWFHRAQDPVAGWRRFANYRDQFFAPRLPPWRRFLDRLLRR